MNLLKTYQNPYDGLPIETWQRLAANAVIADLLGRKGVDHALEDIDLDIREDIISSLEEVINKCFCDESLNGENDANKK